MKKEQSRWLVFWALVFVGVFLVLSQRGYSDGDDVFFYEYTHQMGLFEYLTWRYQNWVGRMSAEALVYMTFHFGLWFWRLVNAGMLVLIPIGLLTLAQKVSGQEKQMVYSIGASIAAATGYLLMGAMTLGYAAVWVNGSIFYTWTFACGIWALMPVAELIFSEEGSVPWWKFLYGIPCALIATMSIEQMGAVLLAFEMIGFIYYFVKQRKIHLGMLIQTMVTVVAFALLFAAPGNEVRVAEEITTWMPEYATMSVGQHIFITVQWLLSSFANENKMFLIGIWLVGIFLLRQERAGNKTANKIVNKTGNILTMLALVFAIVACLPLLGITLLSDMGIHISDITVRIETVPTVENLSAGNVFAMVWWGMALIFTFFFLWKVAYGNQKRVEKKWGMTCDTATVLLTYLAGIASEAIMFFSPTMYASGARVYYLTDLLYLFLILYFSFQLENRKRQQMHGVMVALGIIHLIVQVPVFLSQI